MYQIRLTLIWLSILLTPLFSIAQTPSVNSSQLSIDELKCNIASFSWTSGNGDARLVVLEKDNQNFNPKDNLIYTAGNTYLDALVISTSDTSKIDLSDLDQGSNYWLSIYEYSSQYKYLNDTNVARINFTTESIVFTNSYSDHHTCEGTEVHYWSDAYSTTGDSLSYSWNFKDSVIISDSSVYYTFNTYGIYNVKFTAITYGCTQTKTFKDTAAPYPIVDLFLKDQPNNDSIQCLGSNSFLFDSYLRFPFLGTGHDFANIYWYIGDSTYLTIYPPSHHFNSPGTQEVIYKVSATKNNRVHWCTSADTMRVEVLPHSIDQEDVKISDLYTCLGDSLDLDYLGSDSAYWILANDTLWQNDTTILLSAKGEYALEIIDPSLNTICNSEQYLILVTNCTLGSFPDTIELRKPLNQKDTFTLPKAETYLWSTGATSRSLIIDSDHYNRSAFFVWGEAQNNSITIFRDTTLVIITDYLSINDEELAELSVYPNPTSENLTISCNGTYGLSLYNSQGMLITELYRLKSETTLDLSKLAEGCYFIKVYSNNKTFIKKVIKY